MAEKRKSDAIIRSIDDGIVVVDRELKVTGINPTAAKALHIEYDQIQNKHFLEVVKSEMLFSYVKQSVETGQPPSVEERKTIFTIRRRRETTALPIFDYPGAWKAWVFTRRCIAFA